MYMWWHYVLYVALGLVLTVAAFFVLRRFLQGPIYRSSKRLDGKVAVITGASGGIGLETVRDLCRRGARVILMCRNEAKGRKAIAEVKEQLLSDNDKAKDPIGELDLVLMDLSSLASVRSAAEELTRRTDRIDLLILNAGLMHSPEHPRTKDGFEMQMGTNHLGHYLLTRLLMPTLAKSSEEFGQVRVITVASLAHSLPPLRLRLNDLNWHKASRFDTNVAYQQSKCANILFARELARRCQTKWPRIVSVSLHPGVVDTELTRHAKESSNIMTRLFYFFSFFLFQTIIKTPWHGAQTTLYCCLDDSVTPAKSGHYFSDCGKATPTPNARNDDDARALWQWSATTTGCDHLRDLELDENE